MRYLARSILLVVMTLALLVSGHGGHAQAPGKGATVYAMTAQHTTVAAHHRHADQDRVVDVAPSTYHKHGLLPGMDNCASVSCGIVFLDGTEFTQLPTPKRPLRHIILTGQIIDGLWPALPKRPPRS